MSFLFRLRVVFGLAFLSGFGLRAELKPFFQQEVEPMFNVLRPQDYWQALLLVARKDRQQAMQLIQDAQEAVDQQNIWPWQVERPENIDDFFDRILIDSIKGSPQTLTYLGLLESLSVHQHNQYLDDLSLDALKQKIADAKNNLAILQTYDLQELTKEQQITYKIVKWALEHEVAGEQYLLHGYIIHQMDGVLVLHTLLFTQLNPLQTLQDAQNYVIRLTKVPQQVDQVIECLLQQKAEGIILPRFMVEKIVAMLERGLPLNLDAHAFYLHVANNLQLNLEACDKAQVLQDLKQALELQVYPAYRKLLEYFNSQLPQLNSDHGVEVHPDGRNYYAYMLQRHTTTDFSAEEIHALGLREVEQILTEMRHILSLENLNDASQTVGDLVQKHLATNQAFFYPATAEGREQCIADYQAIIDRSRQELGALFGLKPAAAVNVKRVPEHEEEGSAGAYYCPPNLDGSRPGTFFVNLRDMAENPKYGMETLAIHEAEPGHHFQFAVQFESNLPLLRRADGLASYTAYVEGWALYAEKLAYEHGFYSSSFAKLGHLQDELLRAVRLVVDTGIHHLGWTRQEAIDYMQAVTGYHRASVVTEIERYFVLPGQACAYKIGQLKILQLRDKARTALGDRFKLSDFHDVVLGLATAPLAVLEEVVDHYIADKLAL